MKKMVWVVLALILFPAARLGAEEPARLFPIKQSGKWGYIDKTGKVVVEPKLEEAQKFSDGLGRVKQNGKFGYVDAAGKPVIEPQYSTARDFHEGLALVELDPEDDAWAYIDHQGLEQLFVKTRMSEVKSEYFDVAEGLIRFTKESRYGFMTPGETIVIEPQWYRAGDFSEGLAWVLSGYDGKYGYLDKTGKLVIPQQLYYNKYNSKLDSGCNFSSGLARFQELPSYNFGYLDKTGSVAIKAQFSSADAFSEGLARVTVKGKNGYRDGYIDPTGKFVISPQFESSEGFSEGLAAAYSKFKCGYLDKTGKFVINAKYEFCKAFSGGLAAVGLANNVDAYIDPTGKIVWPSSK